MVTATVNAFSLFSIQSSTLVVRVVFLCLCWHSEAGNYSTNCTPVAFGLSRFERLLEWLYSHSHPWASF